LVTGNMADILNFHCPFTLFRSLNDILVWLTLFLVNFSMIEKIMQRQKFAVAYFCISMFPIAGLMTSFINSLGIVNITFAYHFSFFTGILLEIIFLTFLLAKSYAIIQEEKEELLIQQLELQKTTNYRIAETQEREQRRIAADLHDGLGSALTAIRIMVNNAIHYFQRKGQQEPVETLLNVQQQLDKAVNDVQNIAHNLIPKDFEQHQFTGAIKNYLDRISTNSLINVEYSIDEQLNDLDKQRQVTLFRIFNELLNNCLKHAGCRNITVQLTAFDNIIQLMMEDDGHGFDVTREYHGMGLKNIRSRVNSLSGSIHIDSSQGGTTFIIEIPIN
jgi:signal transduction histidine kinase